MIETLLLHANEHGVLCTIFMLRKVVLIFKREIALQCIIKNNVNEVIFYCDNINIFTEKISD